MTAQACIAVGLVAQYSASTLVMLMRWSLPVLLRRDSRGRCSNTLLWDNVWREREVEDPGPELSKCGTLKGLDVVICQHHISGAVLDGELSSGHVIRHKEVPNLHMSCVLGA